MRKSWGFFVFFKRNVQDIKACICSLWSRWGWCLQGRCWGVTRDIPGAVQRVLLLLIDSESQLEVLGGSFRENNMSTAWVKEKQRSFRHKLRDSKGHYEVPRVVGTITGVPKAKLGRPWFSPRHWNIWCVCQRVTLVPSRCFFMCYWRTSKDQLESFGIPEECSSNVVAIEKSKVCFQGNPGATWKPKHFKPLRVFESVTSGDRFLAEVQDRDHRSLDKVQGSQKLFKRNNKQVQEVNKFSRDIKG